VSSAIFFDKFPQRHPEIEKWRSLMTRKKPPDGDELADLQHVLPPCDDRPPRRRVATESGLAVIAAGGSLEEALAADAEQDARARAAHEAEEHRQADLAEKRRLDIAERRLRIERAARRLVLRAGRGS
jgi:hypothetical protein